MKSSSFRIHICTAIIIAFSVLTACEYSSQVTQSPSNGIETSLEPVASEAPTESSSSEFTLEASSYNYDVDLEAENPSTGEQLVFDVYSSNPRDVTSDLEITTPSESPSSSYTTATTEYIAYVNAPQDISYNGYSALNYTYNGISYSTSLSSNEQDAIDEVQQDLNEAYSYVVQPPHPKTTSEQKAAGQSSLKSMSNNEIKEWLKEKGYKVKKLGNRRFQVTRKYKKKELGKKMSITSVFNADTGKMESGYTASKNGNVISEHNSNRNKNSHKTKIKRKKKDYLILNIKKKNN